MRTLVVIFVAMVIFAIVAILTLNAQEPDSGFQCRDGTWSQSTTRQGACSGHGGIAE